MNTYQQERRETIKKEWALWRKLNAGVAGKPVEKQVWTSVTEIIEILNYIGKHPALNHTFMPSGGGLDLAGACMSHEPGLVELNFDGSPKIIKPLSLIFHAVGDNPEWWYFRLETVNFAPTDVYDHNVGIATEELIPWSQSNEIAWSMQYTGEELLEVSPGNYMDRNYWMINHIGHDEQGYEIPLPEEARLITRKVNGGAFVIFSKFSPYNFANSTYDARHNRMTDDKFRQYIEEIVDGLEKLQ